MEKEIRKSFNYESIILEEMTLEKEGYNSSVFGPASAKFIWCRCRFCGEPHRVRKGFFNKAGSACHKACKLKEQGQFSPMLTIEGREKAKAGIKKKYGVEYASQHPSIAAKISAARSDSQNQEMIKKTCQEKYGVDNPFQAEIFKNKTKETLLEKYGVDHPLKSDTIKEKLKETNIERYGCENPWQNEQVREKIAQTNLEKFGVRNPQQNDDIKNKSVQTHHETVMTTDNPHYHLIQTLQKEEFWEKLKTYTMKDICTEFSLDCRSLNAALLRPEFRDRYYSTYSFPTQQLQKEIYDWLISLGTKVSYNNRSIISPLELDIVDNDKKVAIEFNGSFWHSEIFLGREKAKTKHITKTKLCKEKGYRLIHIFEHTYISHKEQVKNYLKSAFGLNKIKIAARKCTITNDNSDIFLDSYHIQGSPRGTDGYFNLVYNGEIVGCMTAGEHHEKGGDTDACILTRLVFREDTTVQGGASKLFAAMKKWATGQGYKKIISWSDNSISDGHVYPILGFQLEDEYAPSYFYYDHENQRYCTKQSQRKTNKDRPSGMSIKDWNNSREMYVIWDCGKKKWTYFLEGLKHCNDQDVIILSEKIRQNLSFDLVKDGYQGKTPLHGSCYIASEAFYHLFGGEKSGLVVKRRKLDNGVVHWWLERNGEIIDITKGQFDFRVPYETGRNGGFLTKEPSKRCQILIKRIKELV